MKKPALRSLLTLVTVAVLAACAGPRSAVEVYHLRDMVRDGRVEYLSELIAALGSSDESVRSAAVRSLGELGEKAIPRLQQTVREETKRSGPALHALGLTGDPEVLGFIREYSSHPLLGAFAQEAEKEIERRLSAKVQQGDLEAMESYAEAFPDSPKVAQIRQSMRVRQARQTFEKIAARPTVADLEAYLKDYGDTEDAPMARVMAARLLVKEAQGRLELNEFVEARGIIERVPGFDPRREPEAQKFKAQTYLLEGKLQHSQSKDDLALLSLEQASKHPDFRLEADRLRADILMSQARARLDAGNVREGILLAEQAQVLDPVRRPEVASLKNDLGSRYQARVQSTDPVQRKLALVGLISVGEEAARPMELYLGSLFVRKDYAAVEEVVQALAEVKRMTPAGTKNPGFDRVAELLINYLKAALAASTGEINRLFASPEFTQHWNSRLDPIDPRQFSLVFKVDELSGRHLGLSRVGLAMKALLGEGGVDIVRGSLLQEGELRSRLLQGQVGDDPSLALLTRVQLSGRLAGILAELCKAAEAKPERFLGYAVGLNLLPYTTADWVQVAESFKDVLSRGQNGQLPAAASMAGPLHGGRVSLVSADFDQRSLTIQVYDPVVDNLAAGDPAVRAETVNRTLSILLNTARVAFGLYAGIDRYTVILGSTEVPLTSIAQVRGGRFDPESRLMLSQKGYNRFDWSKLRNMNGAYGPTELGMVDLQWNRWTK